MSATKSLFFEKLSHFFIIPSEEIQKRTFLIYIVLAYIFGVFIRLTAFIQANQIKAFWLEGKPISIWTPDAGRYGYYAKEILQGHDLPYGADYLTGHLLAWISGLFGISVEWVMFLLPISIAPLIVIPMMMIAKSIKQPTLGFLAALIATSETYLYARSHLGYMDTDGANLFLVLLAIAFIIKSIDQKKLIYVILASLTLTLFSLWYHSASVINLSIVGITIFTIAVYYRREIVAIQTILILSVVLVPVSTELKLLGIVLIGISLILLNRYSTLSSKSYWLIFVLGTVMAVLFIDPNHYIHRALNYLSPNNQIAFAGNGIEYAYANDLLTVSEVKGSLLWHVGGATPFYLTDIYVIVGIIGYLILLAFYPLFWFALSLFILGLLSGFAGVRFSMFATPVIAFGAVYMLYVLKVFFTNRYKGSVYAKRFPFYAIALILLMMIYNLLIINISAMTHATIYAPEAKVLNQFSKRLTKDDLMLSWWDYGWPLWYYTGSNNTLVDNGKHGGPDTYIIAKMLLSTDQNYTYNTAKLLADNRSKATKVGDEFVVQYLAKEYNLTKLFSSTLSEKILPVDKKDKDTYIILHYKMMDFFGVINQFSQKSFEGKSLGSLPMLRMTALLKPFSENYSLLEGFAYILDSSDGTVVDADNKKTPVSGLTLVQNNTRTKGYLFNQDKNITNTQVIAYRNKFIWVDQEIYDSFFIQAMLFDEYDHTLFEKVGETNRIKIFKLKSRSK